MIEFSRRFMLHLAAVSAAVAAMSPAAWAEAYPSRTLRLIVGFPAGSTADVLARLIGQWLSARLGQPCIVENRPGAGSNTAAEMVAKSAPDGYTLLWVTASNAINATLYQNLRFDFAGDLAGVASVSHTAGLVVINPSFPARSVSEFILAAKANPGKFIMASGGVGSTSHVWGALFNRTAGIDVIHAPYRGDAPALADLIAGRVQVMFVPTPSSIELVRTGKLRAVAITTAARQQALPNVPTVGESLPGFEASGWTGVAVPRGTPVEIIARLSATINSGLIDPTLKERLAGLGSTVLEGSPDEFNKFIADEIQKWRAVIQAAGIKAE